MPYPGKTDRKAILAAALDQLEIAGVGGLSLRALAGSLGLAPNALYRYFSDRAELESALSDASAGLLLRVLLRTVAGKKPDQAIQSMAHAYLKFARKQPRLYEAMMQPGSASGEHFQAHQELWKFVVEQVARIAEPAGAPEAAVALWALLHGMAGLQAAGVFSRGKPASGIGFGLRAWVSEAGRHQGSD